MAFWNRFFGSAGSQAAGIAIGATAVPALIPAVQFLENQAWATHPDKPPDVYLLAQGVAQGQVDPDSAKNWANQQGISDTAFAALVDVANVGPAFGNLLESFRRGDIGPDDFNTGLKRLAIEEHWWPFLAKLKQQPLDPSTVANAVHRGIMRDPTLLVAEPPTTPGHVPQIPPSPLDPATEAAWSGIDHERLRIEVGTAGLPLALLQMLHLLNLGAVTEADVQRSIAEGNVRNEYMDVALKLRRRILTPTEYVDAHLRGYISPQEMYDGTALSGVTPDDTDILFKSHGRPITIHQIATGLARGGVYDGPINNIPQVYLDSLRQGSIKPPWYNIAYANRYSYPSAFVLRSLAQAGELGDADAVKQILLEIGWPPYLAEKVAPQWVGGTGGVSAAVKTEQGRLRTTTHKSYIADEINDAVASDALLTSGLDQADVDAILPLWQKERSLIRAQLSPKDLKKALEEKVTNPATGQPWTRQEALDRLLELGYALEDATVFLDL